jgi:hypothetical protein
MNLRGAVIWPVNRPMHSFSALYGTAPGLVLENADRAGDPPNTVRL